MSEVIVAPVRSKREKNLFLAFPWQIYDRDPLWVPPILPELKQRTDPQHGTFFLHGEAEFFIARRDSELLGTVCAAEDRQANAEQKVIG